MKRQTDSPRALRKQAQLIAAAAEILDEEGIAGLSVRAIADRAKTSTIGVYSHFGGKKGVLNALYISGFEQLGASVEDVRRENTGASHERILLAIDAYLEFEARKPRLYALMFDAQGDRFQPDPEATRAARAAFVKLVAVFLAARPDWSRVHAARIAFESWALVHGLVMLRTHQTLKQSPAAWQRTVRSAARNYLFGAMNDRINRPK
ncbi:MAG TPA: TetR family transcriptional regulator [Alphaproteobacteria bacterium]|nr:TetR family transcriptional regulator [Alphaproteobacteria bacterium]HAJ47840.1 TetR family transcriptional regulator [Alphaproteobacteria bacterium]